MNENDEKTSLDDPIQTSNESPELTPSEIKKEKIESEMDPVARTPKQADWFKRWVDKFIELIDD